MESVEYTEFISNLSIFEFDWEKFYDVIISLFLVFDLIIKLN
jgi:hypothetical protein